VPFGPLIYLYVGSKDVEKDLAYYRDVLGAKVLWDRTGFGARVAAVKPGEGPWVLLADHRPAGTTILIYEVKDLKAAAKDLKARGWKPKDGPFEVPDGPVYTFQDPSGNELAILQVVRPHALGEDA
jgi:predicted enzyme related to lactoylglutathione lyase